MGGVAADSNPALDLRGGIAKADRWDKRYALDGVIAGRYPGKEGGARSMNALDMSKRQVLKDRGAVLAIQRLLRRAA